MGDFLAGTGSMGIDPGAPPPPAPPDTPLAALYFDPFLRDYVLDDQGRAISIHPTDQKVVLALSVLTHSLSGARDFGTTYPSGRLRPDRFVADTESSVRSALAFLLTANEIELVSVEATLEPHGRVMATVQYKNLLLPPGEAPHLTLRVLI